MLEQLSVQFTPNPLAGQPRPRAIRKGAVGRYAEALDYLRMELKRDEYKVVPSSEFSNTFKLTRAFLTTITRMGAVSRMTAGGRQFAYMATPLLNQIKAEDIIERCRLDGLRDEEPDASAKAAHLECTTYGPAEVCPSAIYMIGLISNGDKVLTIPLNGIRPVDPASAMNIMREIPCEPGDKVVLLNVVEVLESARVLQPSTL